MSLSEIMAKGIEISLKRDFNCKLSFENELLVIDITKSELKNNKRKRDRVRDVFNDLKVPIEFRVYNKVGD